MNGAVRRVKSLKLEMAGSVVMLLNLFLLGNKQ